MANPLRDALLAAGARVGERDGVEAALDFGDPDGERRAGRQGPAVADRSARAFLRAEGPDAARLLQNVLTNDVAALGVGAALPSFLLTPKGRPVADVRVARTGEAAYLLECEPLAGEAVLAHLRRYRLASRVELADAAGEVGQLALKAVPLPERAAALIRLPERLWVELLGPVADVRALWDAALAAGARPVGAHAYELLRVEAGVPRQGAEIDETVLPAETGLVEANVAFSKGCYVGQEPVARLHYRGHANRSLRRLRVEGSRAPSLPASVVHERREAGRITSAAAGLDGEDAFALAYVRREVPADATVEVRDQDGIRRASLDGPPPSAEAQRGGLAGVPTAGT